MLRDLKEEVLEANLLLVKEGLVRLTWGNVSGIDRASGLFVIKPSGVAYEDLTIDSLVVLDLDGKVVEGSLRPSSDTPTHRILYREFPEIGGVTHTHSVKATMFSQAGFELPCFGTTHADHFYGTVPVVRELSSGEVAEDYETNTGLAIVECFRGRGLDPHRRARKRAQVLAPRVALLKVEGRGRKLRRRKVGVPRKPRKRASKFGAIRLPTSAAPSSAKPPP